MTLMSVCGPRSLLGRADPEVPPCCASSAETRTCSATRFFTSVPSLFFTFACTVSGGAEALGPGGPERCGYVPFGSGVPAGAGVAPRSTPYTLANVDAAAQKANSLLAQFGGRS